MKNLLKIAAAVSVAGMALAEDQLDLKDAKVRASYAIGADIATSMTRQGIDLDAKGLAAGIADTFTGKLKLTDAEVKQALEEFKTQMTAQIRSKQAAAGAENLRKGEAFLDANGKKEGVKTTASGLEYQLIKAGKADGKSPKSTDTVKVHYHGTLLDGTVFDSSVERGEPATFPLNQVIPGWTEGLQLMKEGDKFKFFIPSKLAYGENAPAKIGPNSVLIFEVELLSIEKPN
jgi:FKBP-type peptidyl-prolyl cis-trans isomerase